MFAGQLRAAGITVSGTPAATKAASGDSTVAAVQSATAEDLLDTADLAAAMTIDAFAGRLGAFDADVHALRPHPGQVEVAARLRALLDGSTLADIAYHLVPRFRFWMPES